MKQKTVLIVDDEQEMAESLGRVIERRGIKALTASTKEEALKLYQENKPDCVFLDLHLSESKGTEVLKKLKEIDPKVKAYLLTGDLVFTERNTPESIGVEGFLLKPIEVEDVFKIVEEL
ncbi:MAG: response regulator [Candidatus Omnitrophica bacterium]|nr:response regulator [Candidatus Omnitrophota bacterium]MBU2044353.1 response regulator [Candidatus Omnitrophota bacterium]MBU2265682.1 response regulator [Candidatus Omnitrophota bacterium]